MDFETTQVINIRRVAREDVNSSVRIHRTRLVRTRTTDTPEESKVDCNSVARNIRRKQYS
jgi:hypothetical protein